MTMDRDGNGNLKGRRHPRRDLETGGTQPKVDFEWQYLPPTYLGGKRPTGTSYLFPSLSTLPSLSRLSSRPSLSLSKLTSLALFRLTSLALLLPSCPPHPDRLDEELAPVLIRTLLSLSSSS